MEHFKGQNHVMVDLETLGTSANALILSIGAVRIDFINREIERDVFYEVISLESSQQTAQSYIDPKTLVWWLSQNKHAQEVFKYADKLSLHDALDKFATFLGDDVFLWGNGSDFDNALLANAYKSINQKTPWKFWNNRCFRTFKNLRKDIKAMNDTVAHNALDDAMAQAQHLIDIFCIHEIERRMLKENG